MKVAIISPYYKESTEVLKRCHDSVLAQNYPGVVHYMIADGHPNPEVDNWDVTHLKVPTHGDFGDTPRAIGSLSAVTHGADALCFLDSDNWLEPDHVELMVKSHQNTGAVVVTATRMLRRLDGSTLGVCNESNGRDFNDTNCYFLTRPAFGALMSWGLKDPREAVTGDRIFWNTICRVNFPRTHVMTPTVNYTTNFACHYQAYGERPPAGTKVIVRFEGHQFNQVVSFEDYELIVKGKKPIPSAP